MTHRDKIHTRNATDNNCTIQLQLPNGDHISSTEKGTLTAASTGITIGAHLFHGEDLQRTLIAPADYTNIGCTVTLTSTAATITKNGAVVLTGTKLPHQKLWEIPMEQYKGQHSCNNIITLQRDAERVAFWHATMGSPPVSTFIKAMETGILALPQLTTKMVRANPPHSMATAMGHLNLNRQHQHAKPSHRTPLASDAMEEDSEDTIPFSEHAYESMLELNTADIHPTTAHSDATGRFPVTSRSGIKYIHVTWYNGYIHFEPMVNRTATEYVKVTSRVIAFFTSKGHTISTQRMDNEDSKALDALLQKHHITKQLVPPNNHRANKAERSIQSSKNHLIAMMSTAHPMCPLELWDESLQQGEIKLNQLHRCPHNPKISSYEAIHGAPYDFLHHPLAPFGTRVIIHETPKDRASWAPHGVPGFYLGPAMDHYRCFRVFASPTESIRISDSIAWYPQPYPMPGSSALEGVHSAITDLDGAIEHLASVHSEISEHRQPVMTKGAEATERLRAMLALYHSPSVQLAEQEAPPQPPAAGSTVEVPDIPPLPTQTNVTEPATDVGTPQVAPIPATVPNEPTPRRSRRIPQHPRRYANHSARTTYGHCNSVAARHLGSDPHSMREAKAMPGLRDA